MLSFLGDVERFLADLYPYRWLILAGILIVLAAAVAFGYRGGWHYAAMRNWRPVAAVLTPSVVLAAVAAWFLLSPLFTNVTVDEELPFDIAAIVPPDSPASGAKTSDPGVPKKSMAIDRPTPSPNSARADKPAADEEADAPTSASQKVEPATETPAPVSQETPSTAPTGTPTEPSGATVASGATAVASPPVPTRTPAAVGSDNPTATVEPTATASSDPTASATALPSADPTPSPTLTPQESSAQEPTATAVSQGVAVKLKSGMFRDADSFHKGSGLATIYRGPDGSLLLRLDDFKVTNGPDLHVVMTSHPDPKNRTELMSETYVDLGKLKGNIGNQNYPIPGNVDVTVQRSVVIYCLPFHVVFSVATLHDEG